MPITLPMCPPEALPIGNSCFAVLISDDTFTYFSNLVPFDSHPADDRAAMLLRIGRLAMVSNIPQRDLVDAFGVSRATVQRAQRRYLAEGEAAFLKPPARSRAVGVHAGTGQEGDSVAGSRAERRCGGPGSRRVGGVGQQVAPAGADRPPGAGSDAGRGCAVRAACR